MAQNKKRLWIVGNVLQTPDSLPPDALTWTCEVCGPQSPIALSGNRWNRRMCTCERAAKKAQIQVQAVIALGEGLGDRRGNEASIRPDRSYSPHATGDQHAVARPG